MSAAGDQAQLFPETMVANGYPGAAEREREHHRQELLIALDPSHPAHLLPRLERHHGSVADLGCGGGGPLFAMLRDAPWAMGFGFDVDRNAILWGRQHLANERMVLETARADRLPLAASSMDFVMARVSLPYMPVDAVLRETARILRPGGDLWLALHSSFYARKLLRKAWAKHDYRDVFRRAGVIVNGIVYHFTGRQVLSETFQTHSRMCRSLHAAGLHMTGSSYERGFVMTAKKPGAGAHNLADIM